MPLHYVIYTTVKCEIRKIALPRWREWREFPSYTCPITKLYIYELSNPNFKIVLYYNYYCYGMRRQENNDVHFFKTLIEVIYQTFIKNHNLLKYEQIWK